MNKKIIGLFIVGLGFSVFVNAADSNGVWHNAEDVRGGVFSSDETEKDFTFIGKVNLGFNTSYKGIELDAKFVNTAELNSINSDMIIDGSIKDSDIGFNYAESSSKGGDALNSLKLEGSTWSNAPAIISPIIYDKDDVNYKINPYGTSEVVYMRSHKSIAYEFVDRDNISFFINPSWISNINKLSVRGQDTDSRYINTGEANSVNSDMIIDGNIKDSDIGFNYAESSSKGGDALNSLKLEGSTWSNAPAITSPVIYDKDDVGYKINPYGTSDVLYMRSHKSISYEFVDRDNTAFFIDPSSTSNIYKLSVRGQDTDSRYMNTGEANSVNSDMIIDGSIKDSDIGFNYAESSSKGGDALNSLKLEGTTWSNAPAITSPIIYDKDDVVYKIDLSGMSNINQIRTKYIESPKFVDRDNLAFFIDPSGNSVFNTLTIRGQDTDSRYINTGEVGSITRVMLANGTVDSSKIDTNTIQKRVSSMCGATQAIRGINVDGSVVCIDVGTVTPTVCSGPDGASIPDGGSEDYFLDNLVPFGDTCSKQTRVCTGTTLNGTYIETSCSVVGAVSCTLPDGNTIAHSSSKDYFLASSVPFGNTCVKESRTCNNGVLNGTYLQPSCTQVIPSSCTGPDGNTIAHSNSKDYFLASSVPFGNTCVNESRTCDNGDLSGDYNNANCVVKQDGGWSYATETSSSCVSSVTTSDFLEPYRTSCTPVGVGSSNERVTQGSACITGAVANCFDNFNSVSCNSNLACVWIVVDGQCEPSGINDGFTKITSTQTCTDLADLPVSGGWSNAIETSSSCVSSVTPYGFSEPYRKSCPLSSSNEYVTEGSACLTPVTCFSLTNQFSCTNKAGCYWLTSDNHCEPTGINNGFTKSTFIQNCVDLAFLPNTPINAVCSTVANECLVGTPVSSGSTSWTCLGENDGDNALCFEINWWA